MASCENVKRVQVGPHVFHDKSDAEDYAKGVKKRFTCVAVKKVASGRYGVFAGKAKSAASSGCGCGG